MKALVIVPTYNEIENLPKLVPAALAASEVLDVLVVDDSSPDGTGECADALAANSSRVHVLHRQDKQGLGKAYVAGFKWALERDYDAIIEMDADFSHDPAYLPAMVANLRYHDVVVGSRYVHGGGTVNWSWDRRILSRGGGLYARSVLGVRIQDLTAGFVGYRRQVLETLDLDNLDATGYAFQIEMKYRAVRAGFSLVEVPIVFPDRVAGESKMDASIFSEALLLVWRLRFQRPRG